MKSFCGNQIKEDDEQCDCGFTQQDCQEMGDQCCTPREGATESSMCKRKPGKICSPSEGLCCNARTCSFYFVNDHRLCREDSECQEQQYCDGRQAGCPLSKNKINGKPCQDITKVQYNSIRKICLSTFSYYCRFAILVAAMGHFALIMDCVIVS